MGYNNSDDDEYLNNVDEDEYEENYFSSFPQMMV
jgi:hypothetical protein